MAEERLVESIKIKCYPNSYFNWYEKVSTWLGKVSNRYELIIRNEPIKIFYTSSVGEIGMICESFYRSGDNGAFQGLLPKFTDYNKKHILFILSVLLKTFNNFEKVKNFQ